MTAPVLFNEGYTSVKGEYVVATGEFLDSGIPVNFQNAAANLRLTTRDGRTLIYDSATGELRTSTDPNGNWVSFTGDIIGYDANNNETGRLKIVRQDDLITRIEDGLEHSVVYAYDSSGNLETFTDPVAVESKLPSDLKEMSAKTIHLKLPLMPLLAGQALPNSLEVDGLKLDSHPPEIMKALLDEAKVHGLGSTAHLSQNGVAQMNAIDASCGSS